MAVPRGGYAECSPPVGEASQGVRVPWLFRWRCSRSASPSWRASCSSPSPTSGDPARCGSSLRFTLAFLFCAVSACVLYAIARAGGGLVFQIIGDTAMVLAPSLLFVGLCVLTERRALEPGVLAFALTVTVAVVSTTVPQPTPLAVKGVAGRGGLRRLRLGRLCDRPRNRRGRSASSRSSAPRTRCTRSCGCWSG